jgi:hypothetical protein
MRISMGIAPAWPAILSEEGGFTLIDKPPTGVKTIFCDFQIRLMQSFVPPGVTWREFVKNMFISYIRRQHTMYDVVIISFDDPAQVPLYKSIEQQRRSNKNTTFSFTSGQNLPSNPPSQDIWPSALLNRAFKLQVYFQNTVSVIIIGEMEMWRCSNHLFQVAICTIFQRKFLRYSLYITLEWR